MLKQADSYIIAGSLEGSKIRGVTEGKPEGLSALCLSNIAIATLAGVIAIGGDAAAREEVEYAVRCGLPVKLLPCRNVKGEESPVQQWFAEYQKAQAAPAPDSGELQ